MACQTLACITNQVRMLNARPQPRTRKSMRSHGRSMNRLFVCARNTIRPKLEEIVRRVLHETHGRCVAMTLEGGIILELVQRGTEPAVRPRAIFSRSHS